MQAGDLAYFCSTDWNTTPPTSKVVHCLLVSLRDHHLKDRLNIWNVLCADSGDTGIVHESSLCKLEKM